MTTTLVGAATPPNGMPDFRMHLRLAEQNLAHARSSIAEFGLAEPQVRSIVRTATEEAGIWMSGAGAGFRRLGASDSVHSAVHEATGLLGSVAFGMRAGFGGAGLETSVLRDLGRAHELVAELGRVAEVLR